MKTLVAKYPGTCRACGKPILEGQMIRWYGRGQAEHASHGSISEQRAPCWKCGDPEGKFRNYGAATPVYCDTCEAAERAKRVVVGNVAFQKPAGPDYFDMMVEDNMRDACGC